MLSIFFALSAAAGLFAILWGLIFGPLGGAVYLLRSALRRGSSLLARTQFGKKTISHARWPGVTKYAPLTLILAGGAVAALAFGYAFTELSLLVTDSASPVITLDRSVWAYFGGARQEWLTYLFRASTEIGGWPGSTTLVLVVAGILLKRKENASALYIVVTAVGGKLLNVGLKEVFERARPDLTDALAFSQTFSFPSGHAMSSFVIFGSVAVIAVREQWRGRYKSAALAAAATMIVLVGVSRVYLGVHWTSDIAGGWSAGFVWLVAVTATFELLLRIRQRRRGESASGPESVVPDRPE